MGVEQRRLPRHKPCAGVLYPRVLEDFNVPRDAVVARLRRVKLVAPSGRSAFIDFTEPGAIVDRAAFDHALVKQAVEAGARVVDGARAIGLRISEGACTVEVEGLGPARAKFIVAADGVYSRMARLLRRAWRRDQLALALQAYAEPPSLGGEEGVFEVRYNPSQLPGGWWWVVWRRRPVIVGVGQLLELSQGPHRLRELLKSLVDELKLRVVAEEAYMLPLKGPRRVEELVHADRVLLIGDAGGFVRSDTGEGVYYAMHSGEAAAEAVAEALSSGGRLSEAFEERLRDHGLLQLYEASELHEALRSVEAAEEFVERVARLSLR